MKLDISKLEKKLKIKIKNKYFFERAFTHKSANPIFNNERIEFLGDRVIALILSKRLLELYPSESEGILDKKLSKLVNKKTCASIAWTIGLNNFLILGNSQKRLNKNDEKILSDLSESLIGALYLDKGFNFVEKFVLNVWKKNLLKSKFIDIDAKTKLQEYSLKIYKKLPIYQIEEFSGPKHRPFIKVSVRILNTKKFLGTANSKQKAQQIAAKRLLASLEYKT